ncbi:MAG: family 16 glycoside hydrolase [Ktedonobacteraceae bacterium]
MQCISCGTPIPPGATHCPLCGMPAYDPGVYQETVHSSPNHSIEPTHPADAYSPGIFQEAPHSQANPPSDRTVPADNFQSAVRSTPPSDSYIQSPYESTQQQPPYTPAQQPFPPYEPPQQQLYLPAQQPFPPYEFTEQQMYLPAQQPTPPYAQNQQQQQVRYVAPPLTYNQQPPSIPPTTRPGRGLSRGFMIVLVLLALLIILSGFGLIYYSTVYQPNQIHAQGTATAQTNQTRITQATATAHAQATGTAIAVVNATATANAVATAHVVGTATALQSIYTHATSGNPVLNEPLNGNTGSNWDVDQAQGGGGCGFNGGSYRASIYSKGFYFSCFAQNTNFSNFAFQVQMNITRGDSGGLIFRGNSATTKFYAFQVGQDGSYDLFASQDRTHSSDLLFSNSPTIKKNTGQTNLVTIIARGGNISFYINKRYTGSVSDGTFKSGQIGLFASDHTHPTDVTFSNLQIWNL